MTHRPLLHIGYAKAGSSWLQRNLFNNPLFGFVSPLERTALCQAIAFPTDFEFDARAARSMFQAAAATADAAHRMPVFSEERFVGIMHSGGIDGRIIADRLVEVLPEARILIVIREQNSMIRSAYGEYVKVGGAAALKHYLSDYQPYSLALFRDKFYFYHGLIDAYMRRFGKERVLVLPFELLRESPARFAGAILNFCDLPTPHGEAAEAIYGAKNNVGLSCFEVAMTRHMNFWFGHRCPHNSTSVLPILPAGSRRLWFAGLRRITRLVPRGITGAMEARMKAAVAAYAGERFAESNRETARLTGLDLEAYGYKVR